MTISRTPTRPRKRGTLPAPDGNFQRNTVHHPREHECGLMRLVVAHLLVANLAHWR
jgi:hypothetical protein